MRIRGMGDIWDDIDAGMLGTNVDPNILPLEPGTVAGTAIATTTDTTANYNWLNSLLAPLVSVANNAITQRAITQRTQMQIDAGIMPGTVGSTLPKNAAGQSLLFGIPVIYLLGGGAAWLLLKK